MQINIEKRHIFIIISALVLLSGLVIVVSYSNPIPNPGHGADKVWVSTSSGEMTLQSAIDSGVFSGSYNPTNCLWTDSATATRPNWATATCPDGKYLFGWDCYWSVNTEANQEIQVMPTNISCRYKDAGTSATVKAYCCNA